MISNLVIVLTLRNVDSFRVESPNVVARDDLVTVN